MSAEVATLLLADGRLPTGGHAQSAGLEPALRSGMEADDIPLFIEARLRTVGLVDASAAVLARRAAENSPSELAAIQAALQSRAPSAPLRAASALLGRGLARLATRWWPGHPAVLTLTALDDPPMRPIALGVVAARSGLDDSRTARASLYDDVQTVAAAALKLVPVDPADAAEWVLTAGASVESAVIRAVAVEDADTMPATAAPQLELWSLEHDVCDRRLFVA